jgi:hypothetical protein
VVPAPFTDYFAATAAAAGVLIGLLFVSVSLRPDSVFGDGAPQAGATLAGSAFTSLVNTFFVSLLALIPKDNLGWGAIVMAAISLYGTGRLNRHGKRDVTQLLLLVLSIVVFLGQAADGAFLLARPHDNNLVYNLAYLVVSTLGVALARAWALLQGKHIRAAARGSEPTSP